MIEFKICKILSNTFTGNTIFSKKTFLHPLDMASKPTAPDPEKQSRKKSLKNQC